MIKYWAFSPAFYLCHKDRVDDGHKWLVVKARESVSCFTFIKMLTLAYGRKHYAVYVFWVAWWSPKKFDGQDSNLTCCARLGMMFPAYVPDLTDLAVALYSVHLENKIKMVCHIMSHSVMHLLSQNRLSSLCLHPLYFKTAKWGESYPCCFIWKRSEVWKF